MHSYSYPHSCSHGVNPVPCDCFCCCFPDYFWFGCLIFPNPVAAAPTAFADDDIKCKRCIFSHETNTYFWVCVWVCVSFKLFLLLFASFKSNPINRVTFSSIRLKEKHQKKRWKHIHEILLTIHWLMIEESSVWWVWVSVSMSLKIWLTEWVSDCV